MVITACFCILFFFIYLITLRTKQFNFKNVTSWSDYSSTVTPWLNHHPSCPSHGNAVANGIKFHRVPFFETGHLPTHVRCAANKQHPGESIRDTISFELPHAIWERIGIRTGTLRIRSQKWPARSLVRIRFELMGVKAGAARMGEPD